MSTSRICSRHFDRHFDFKTRIEILNVYHPYKRWNLNAGAIPKHFLLNGINIIYPVQSFMHKNGTIFILDTSSRQAMQNFDFLKWRNNLNGIFTYVVLI
jgi:hypothetical protein